MLFCRLWVCSLNTKTKYTYIKKKKVVVIIMWYIIVSYMTLNLSVQWLICVNPILVVWDNKGQGEVNTFRKTAVGNCVSIVTTAIM